MSDESKEAGLFPARSYAGGDKSKGKRSASGGKRGHVPLVVAFIGSLVTAGGASVAGSMTTSFIDRSLVSRQAELHDFAARRDNLNRFTDRIIVERIAAYDSAFDTLTSVSTYGEITEALGRVEAASKVYRETDSQFRFNLGDYDKAVYRPFNTALVLSISPSFDRLNGCLRQVRNARAVGGTVGAQTALGSCFYSAEGASLSVDSELSRLRVCSRSFADNLKWPQQSIADGLTVNLESVFWKRALAVIRARQADAPSGQLGLSRLVTPEKMKLYVANLPAELATSCGALRSSRYGAAPAPTVTATPQI